MSGYRVPRWPVAAGVAVLAAVVLSGCGSTVGSNDGAVLPSAVAVAVPTAVDESATAVTVEVGETAVFGFADGWTAASSDPQVLTVYGPGEGQLPVEHPTAYGQREGTATVTLTGPSNRKTTVVFTVTPSDDELVGPADGIFTTE